MNDGDLSCELGQVKGFFHRRIASAHYEYFKVFEESRIAGRAVGYAFSCKFLFARTTDGYRGCSSRDDYGLCTVCIFLSCKDFFLAFQLHIHDGVEDFFCSEVVRLPAHPIDEGRSGFFFQSSGIVFDLRCLHDLAAVLILFNDQCG